ncbi:MAG: class I SAM-dependent methyltransferase [Clostridia bacterium]|nr:class I SAM-dependent methyltransferase [Clostridia bacterium]
MTPVMPVIRAYPVYKFLFWAEQTDGERTVLDCGAGGDLPPLSLFYCCGYRTTGIDMSEDAIREANNYSKAYGMNLNISPGDMRQLEFPNCSFGFVYSYNSIFHMTKPDISRSVDEMRRVLKPEGLAFINLLSIQDDLFGVGNEVGANQFIQEEEGGPVMHSFYGNEEADSLFKCWQVVHKEERSIDRMCQGESLHQVYIDYILRKLPL